MSPRSAIDDFVGVEELDQRERDIALLRLLVNQPLAYDKTEYCDASDGVTERELEAFEDMLAALLGIEATRRESLTEKQRGWAEATAKRLGLSMPSVRQLEMFPSLTDNSKVPRGAEVETPEVLKNLPKSPPRRRRTEA